MEILSKHAGFIALNVIGGVAVLGSYVWGFMQHPEEARLLWGDVPSALRPLYTVCMLLATAGYFFFTAFLLSRLPPGSTALAGGNGWGLVSLLYGTIMVASALWMPFSFRLLEGPDTGPWVLVRVLLAAVGLASIALLIVILGSDLDKSGWLYPAAIAGLVAFSFQTAVLDGLVWPYYFR